MPCLISELQFHKPSYKYQWNEMSKLLAFPQYMYLYFNITNLLTIVMRKAPNLEIVLFHDHRIQKFNFIMTSMLQKKVYFVSSISPWGSR